MLISPNMVLGRYKIRSAIGKGGMGEVFLADDTELERPAAVKVLLEGVADDNEGVRRFVQEAKAASALNHPNILTIYEIGNLEDTRFIASEYIKGHTLRELLRRGQFDLHDAIDIATQVAAALDAAHGVGIVHRDIKPENIMVRDDGLVKVLDFGLAKLITDHGETVDSEGATLAQIKTVRGALVGTVNYMSPEQARGKDVDTRTDLWSLGVVLYEMLTLTSPFAGETSSDTIAGILKSDPAPVSRELPHEVFRILGKTLQKNRDERYQTARDLLLDLKNLKRELEFDSQARLSGSSRPVTSGLLSTGNGLGNITGLHGSVQTTGNISQQASSAEYIVTSISKHKRAWMASAVFVLLAVSGVAAYFSFFATRAEAVDSIAVLPFTNVGGVEDNEYLSDGLSEALINNLSQLPQLKVIARTSSFKYKGRDVDPLQVGKELGVKAIVIGRVLQRGDDYQISVELVNAGNNTQIWGETYSRRVSDFQTLQEDIVQTISQKLHLNLSGDQEQQITKNFTNNPQAYQAYLNGVFYGRKRGVENMKRSLDYYNQAVELDRNFALAYVGQATAYNLLVGSDVVDPTEGKAKARAAVERALAIDDKLAEAHVALARSKNNELNWPGAEQSYRRAIELSPNYAAARNFYAFYLSVQGRHDEALSQIQRATELDPLSLHLKSIEGSILYFARRYDDAVSQLQASIAHDREDTFAHAYLGLTYAAMGKPEEADAAFSRVNEIQGETTSTMIYIGRVRVIAGRTEEAKAILEKLETTDQYVSLGELASLYAAFGEIDKAFETLEKAYAANDLQLQFLKVDPGYDPLRNDPRFDSILRRVNVAP